MQEALVADLRVHVDAREIKACEDGCGGHAVKAMAVIKNAKSHLVFSFLKL
jgi:hypothetical protein